MDNPQVTSIFTQGVIHFHHCPGLSGPGSSSPPPDTWRSLTLLTFRKFQRHHRTSAQASAEIEVKIPDGWTPHGTSISIARICPGFDENSADLKRQTLGRFTQRGPFYQQTKGKYEATRIVGRITTQKLGVWGRILKWWNYVALPFLRLSGTKMGSQEKQLKNGEN